MLVVRINSARSLSRVVLPASTAVNFLALLEVVVPVGAILADAAALLSAPGLLAAALRALTASSVTVPLLVVSAGGLGIDAAPSLLGPDLIAAAEVFGHFPVFVFLALALIALPNTLITNRAGFL